MGSSGGGMLILGLTLDFTESHQWVLSRGMTTYYYVLSKCLYLFIYLYALSLSCSLWNLVP